MNERFVPFLHDNDLYTPSFYQAPPSDPAQREAWELLLRIRSEEEALGLQHFTTPIANHVEGAQGGPFPGVSAVHMSLLDSQTRVQRLLPLDEFLDPAALKTRLKAFADAEGALAGPTVVPARLPPTARRASPTDLLLYLVTRFQIAEGQQPRHEGALSEVQHPPAGWEAAPGNVLTNRVAAPAQDWFLLAEPLWRSLVGTPTLAVGSTWEVSTEAQRSLGVHFGPPGETYAFAPRRIQRQALTARLVSRKGGVQTLELRGSLDLLHPWWDHQDDEHALCQVAGLLTYNEASEQIESFQLASTEARYVGGDLRPTLSIPYAIGMHMPDAKDLARFGD